MSMIQAAKISAEAGAATKGPAVIEVRPTSVWDTDDNVINTKIVKLRLDPRFDDAQAEADEAAAAQYAHIAHAARYAAVSPLHFAAAWHWNRVESTNCFWRYTSRIKTAGRPWPRREIRGGWKW